MDGSLVVLLTTVMVVVLGMLAFSEDDDRL